MDCSARISALAVREAGCDCRETLLHSRRFFFGIARLMSPTKDNNVASPS